MREEIGVSKISASREVQGTMGWGALHEEASDKRG